MRYLFVVMFFVIGCATTPPKADLLVRYPLKGEIVQMYHAGNIDQDQQFIVDYKELKKFLNEIEKDK